MQADFDYHRIILQKACFPMTLPKALAQAGYLKWPTDASRISISHCRRIEFEDNKICYRDDIELGRWDFVRYMNRSVLVRASGVDEFRPRITDVEILRNARIFFSGRRRFGAVRTIVNFSEESADILFNIKAINLADNFFEVWLPHALAQQFPKSCLS